MVTMFSPFSPPFLRRVWWRTLWALGLKAHCACGAARWWNRDVLRSGLECDGTVHYLDECFTPRVNR